GLGRHLGCSGALSSAAAVPSRRPGGNAPGAPSAARAAGRWQKAPLVGAMTAVPPSSPGSHEPVDAQKRRRGLRRLWHALGYSATGLRAGWQETAFRQEAMASLIL